MGLYSTGIGHLEIKEGKAHEGILYFNFKFIGAYSTDAVRAFRAGKIDIDYMSPPTSEIVPLSIKEQKWSIDKDSQSDPLSLKLQHKWLQII